MTTGGFDLSGIDMGALLAQAQSVQGQLEAAQNQLAESSFEGTAGGGLVRATVTGTGDLDALTIAPEALEGTDAETLADPFAPAASRCARPSPISSWLPSRTPPSRPTPCSSPSCHRCRASGSDPPPHVRQEN